MAINDAEAVKKRILGFLERNGASLPVHIARDAGMDMIFTSAFLSELISNQKIKVSSLKIGTSPVYMIPGEEKGLERFSEYLKGKEREAFNLLKRERFLEDSKQEPAIKIALRSLKDFAKPFDRNGRIIWRYFLVEENEFEKEEEKSEPEFRDEIKTNEEKTPKKNPESAKENELAIPDREKPKKDHAPPKKKVVKRKAASKKSAKEKDDKFFNKVKEFISKEDCEILDILSFNKKDLIMKVKKDGKEKLIIAYNKKKITENDVMGAYKKASAYGLGYSLLSLGEAPKRIKNFFDAAKNMDSLEKIE